MARHPFIFSMALTFAVAAGGCAGSSPLLSEEGRLVQASPNPGPSPTVARSQKADAVADLVRVALLDPVQDTVNGGGGGNGLVAARISATVNGVPIFDEEVEATSYQFIFALRDLPEAEFVKKKRAIEKEALDQLIERELILQDAAERLKKGGPKIIERLRESANKEFDRRWVKAMMKGNNIKTDADFKELLRRQGLSLATIQRQWVRQFMATEYLRSRVMPYVDKPGHEHMLDYYESHPGEFQVDDSVNWQDIFISARNKKYATPEAARKVAEDIARRLRAGADFKALCDEYDDGLSRDRGGAGEGHKRGEIRPAEVDVHLFAMHDGDVGPVVEIGSGFHVIRVIKREVAGLRPFDEDVQKEIRVKLRTEAFTRETKKIIADLKKKAVVIYARSRT